MYLDYNSTAPVDFRVLGAMYEVYREHFGNPSSTHQTGAKARDLIDKSRATVASLLGADVHDVIFTSGATEANNTAVSWLSHGPRNRGILYGATEHKSVIRPCTHMAKRFGVRAIPIPVTRDGVIDLEKYEVLLADSGAEMVSIMAANSETGVINPVREAAALAKEYGAILHCDATQAAGKIPFHMNDLCIDIATISAHKIYGPKGVGALVAPRYVRKQLEPVVHGGGQESNLRSGTENVPGIVGFAKACEIAKSERLADAGRQARLRDYLEDHLASTLGDISVNGKSVARIPNTTNVRIAGALADAVVVNLQRTEISTGSACSSSTMEPSHVLLAMGLNRREADESIRISLGRPTTREDVDIAIQDIVQAAEYVRTTSIIRSA